MKGLTFAKALEIVQNGGKARRESWPEAKYLSPHFSQLWIFGGENGGSTYIENAADRSAKDWTDEDISVQALGPVAVPRSSFLKRIEIKAGSGE